MLKKLVHLSFVFGFSLILFAPAVLAAPPSHAGGNKKPGGGGGDSGGSASTIGYDVSWPQCGQSLPTDAAFAIVGVNGGLATTPNDCLDAQLQWAYTSSGAATGQDKVQLYVNTANPGEVLEQYGVTSWPTNNIDPLGNETNNPYGDCIETPGNYNNYTNSSACSWQYGWNRAVEDVNQWFAAAVQKAGVNENAADYFWWLDVETENSWQESAANLSKNAATLEGMVAYLEGAVGARVGIYSTHYQWGVIVGDTVDTSSNLQGLDSWLAGARNEKDARKRCTTETGLTGGQVSLVQYVSKNLDHNVSCL